MCGGGKSGQSTQSQYGSVAGSPQAMGMADAAWGKAAGAAALPFQTYGGEFVAPINQQQTTGISGINDASGTYAPYGGAAVGALQPYFGQATGTLGQGLSAGQAFTGAGAGLTAANATLNPNSVQQWMSPYIQNVVQATENQQQQQNQIQQSQLEGSAIQSGAFGGDRSGVAAANLAYQQNLANQPVIANLYNQGFSTALGAAQQQQQTGLQAGAQFGQLGSQLFGQGLSGSQQYQNLGQGLSGAYSGLGTTAQQNQLGVANAQIGAGTLQQQTQQAQDAALYNQFLQQQAYPFQTSQFLTNAATGLAPIYGTQSSSTGTAGQPISFFRRGGRVGPMVELEMDDNGEYRPRKAGGGGLSDDTLASLIAAHGQMYLPRAPGGDQGPYGAGLSGGSGGGHTQMPTVNLPSMGGGQKYDSGVGRGLSTANGAVEFGKNLGGLYSAGKEAAVGRAATKTAPASGGWWGYGGTWGASGPSGGTATAPAPTTAYTNAGGQLVDASGNPIGSSTGNPAATPTLPDGTLISDSVFARGGRIGLAAGGLPYTSGISESYIPNDLTETDTLPQQLKSMLGGGQGAGGSGQRSSGLSSAMNDANSAISLGTSLATFAPMLLALKHGGRIGKEGGGGLSGDPVVTGLTPVTGLIDPNKVKAIETGGGTDENPKFPQKEGGPAGPHQFIRKTWGQFAQENPQFFSGMTPEQIDAARKDEKVSSAATLWYAGKNKPTLEAAGIPATPENLYLAHGQGAGGATALLKAPDKNVLEALTPVYGNADVAKKAILDNGGKLDMTAGQFAQTFQNRYTGAKPDQSADPKMAATLLAMNGPPPANATPAPADKPDFWSRESGGLSGTERAVISLLSGLGGMASSPSRFFGGALLSGLGAGANTYGQLGMRGKQLDIEQQQANTAVGKLGVEQMAKNIELYNQLRVLAGGYTRTGQPVPQWISDQMNSIGRNLYGGQSPMPGGGAMPGGVTPASGGGLSTPTTPPSTASLPPAQPTQNAPLPAPVKVEPLPSPKAPEINMGDPTFRKALGPDRDPISLRERARETAAFGDVPGSEKLMERADKLEQEYRSSGKATGEDGKVIDVPGFAENQASVGRVGENQKWIDDQSTQAMTRSQAREQLDVIKGVLENYESGSLAGMKAQAQALAKALGVNLPNTATMDAAAYQEFLKSAMRNVFTDVKDMGGRPLVSEIAGFEKATAHPELQPEANKMILSQMYARLNQLDKYYGDISTSMTGNKSLDRGAYTADWLKKKENQLAPLVDEAAQGLAVRGATPKFEDVKPGHSYIIEPGQEKAYGLPPEIKLSGPTKMKRAVGPNGQLGWKPING